MGVVLKRHTRWQQNIKSHLFSVCQAACDCTSSCPQRNRHTQWLSLLTAVQMQTAIPSPRHWEWPSGCYSMAAPPPSCPPAHSLSSMPLIVLGRGGPFLLTSLVLLSLQGPALRTWNCWESLDVTGDTAPAALDHLRPHTSLLFPAAPIKAGLRRRVVAAPGDADARGKGIHWRRGLRLLQTGRGLLVSILLFSLLRGELISIQLTGTLLPIMCIWCLSSTANKKFITRKSFHKGRNARYWFLC